MSACLLGAGCEQSSAPGTSSFTPEAQYVPAQSVSLTTRISGVAWDPEAFFMSLVACGSTCPMPPFLSEGLPLYQSAAVRGGSVSALDPTTGTTVGDPVSSDGVGIWALPKVPSRDTAPYFVVSSGQGALPTEPLAGPLLPPIPPTQYLKTLTLRPIQTVSGSCLSMEAVHVGSTGVLQAVAKHLSSQGKPTVVSDLLDPTRYHSVTVVGLFHAGNGALRAPAAQTAVSATSVSSTGAQVSYPVYLIDWAPPGTPPSTRSNRGFIVSTAGKTPVGFAVVLVPATEPRPAEITYTVTDSVEDAMARRPWVYPPVKAPPVPGLITFLGIQMGYQPPEIPLFQLPPPPSACVPL